MFLHNINYVNFDVRLGDTLINPQHRDFEPFDAIVSNPPYSIPLSYYSCPDNNPPHMIDLGLPSGTQWACCNVGADKPEAYGGFYAWGETEEKSIYDWSTYIATGKKKPATSSAATSLL